MGLALLSSRQQRQIRLGNKLDAFSLQRPRNVVSRSRLPRLYVAQILSNVGSSNLPIVPSNSHQPFAWLTRPANHKYSFRHFPKCRVENFVACFRIGRLRICHVSFFPKRQAHRSVVHVANGKDHRVHFEIDGLLSHLGCDAVVAIDQNIFCDCEARNPAIWTGRDRDRRVHKPKCQTRTNALLLRVFCQAQKCLFRNFRDVLSNRGHSVLNSEQFILKRLSIKVHVDVLKFLIVELRFQRPTACHHDYLFGVVSRIVE